MDDFENINDLDLNMDDITGDLPDLPSGHFDNALDEAEQDAYLHPEDTDLDEYLSYDEYEQQDEAEQRRQAAEQAKQEREQERREREMAEAERKEQRALLMQLGEEIQRQREEREQRQAETEGTTPQGGAQEPVVE